MGGLFESLLTIETLAELKLTLCVLAKATRSGDECPVITYDEFRLLTNFSPCTIVKGLNQMQARGYIIRHTGNGKQASRYQVLWDKIGIGANPYSSAERVSNTTNLPNPGTVEYYFTDTGFFDLLPQARDIANSLGYGDEEMIQAVCWVFDKQRWGYPPTINRTKWFMTVFREKIQEAHADILADRQRKSRGIG